MTLSENCGYCKIIEGRQKSEIIYKDDDFIAFLAPKPCAMGHIVIIPSDHITIFEQIHDAKVGKMFNLANKLSTLVFESFGAGGTNLIISNGTAAGQIVPHVGLHIIPRREGDNLNFQWAAKKLSDEEMGTAELMLKDACKDIGAFEKEKKEAVNLDVKKTEEIKADKGEENYMIKQLERIP